MKRSFSLYLALVACAIVVGATITRSLAVKEEFVEKIMAALPKEAPAEPGAPRKVLVFSKTNGFRHGSIPTGIL
ncbi:MAG: hypothetical protein ACKVHP_04835, partial [Verrucomicrobiales bacterium]